MDYNPHTIMLLTIKTEIAEVQIEVSPKELIEFNEYGEAKLMETIGKKKYNTLKKQMVNQVLELIK